MKITREQAVCMFFSQECNEANIARFVKRIDDLKDIDICYEKDPTSPVLVCVLSINNNPFRYHRYFSMKSLSTPTETTTNKEKLELNSETQIVQFLNEVFLPQNPHNEAAYDFKFITINEILAFVWRYTSLLDDKSCVSFAKWCSKHNVRLMKISPERKRRKENDLIKTRVRSLYVMKEDLIDDIIFMIVNYLPRYHLFIKNLKREGFEVIGYARKSPGKEDDGTRIRLLQQMVDRLRERSLVTKVFVSPRSCASDPFSARDSPKETGLVEQIVEAEGNTQDLISYIGTAEKICLVILGFAGLSTNCLDLEQFIRKNMHLKKIIVDHLPYKNEFEVFERDQLLEDQNSLAAFNCRQKCLQRSR